MPDLTPGQERALLAMDETWRAGINFSTELANKMALALPDLIERRKITRRTEFRLTEAGIARKAALLERDAGGE